MIFRDISEIIERYGARIFGLRRAVRNFWGRARTFGEA
jgi:hypothetical protein